MTERNIHKRFLNEAPPIDIPPVNDAWKEMEKKLNEDEQEKPFILWKRLYAVVVALLLLTAAGLLLPHNYFYSPNTPAKKTLKNNSSLALNDKGSKPLIQNDQNELTAQKQIHSSFLDSLKTDNKNSSKSNFVKVNREQVNIVSLQEKGLRKLSSGESKPIQDDKPVAGVAKAFNDEVVIKNHSDAIKSIQDSIKEPGNNLPIPKDSNTALESEKEVIRDYKIIRAGLQWSAQLPLNGAQKYAAGPGGSAQLYRFLLPGIWISLEAEKYLFTMEANPFASSLPGNKPYSVKNTSNGSVYILETRTLHKIFGTTAGAGFHYNVRNKWWLGLNIQANFWSQGTATVKGESVNSTSGTPSVLYENSFAFNDSSWTNFTKFQMGTGVQLLYKKSKWQAGLRFDFNMIPIIDKAGQKNKTGAQVFIRLPLYSSYIND